MIIADIIGFFAAGITILPHTSMFVIGRFLSGIMVGLLSSASSTYMSEISPSEIRGKTGSFFQLLRMMGLTSAYVLGLGLPTDFDDSMNDWWRFMFAYPALLNILQGLMFLFVFKYESPYWLVKNGKSEEALSVLSSLYVYDVDKVYEQISSVKADPLDSEITGPYLVKIGKMFTTPKVKKMLRLALILGVFQPLSGYSAIATYSTMLFTAMTGDIKVAKQYTVIFGCVGIFAVFVMMQLIERYGRKSLFIGGTIGMLISNLLVGSFLVSGLSTPYPTLAFIYFYMFNFNLSIGPVLFPYISEIGIPLATSLCVGILWLGFLVVGIIVPYAIAGFGPGPLFYIFMGICIMGLIYILIDVVETKGKTKEEIRKIIVKDDQYQRANKDQSTADANIDKPTTERDVLPAATPTKDKKHRKHKKSKKNKESSNSGEELNAAEDRNVGEERRADNYV
jgi:SP family arabinose:H+ symporter-like MFS transporter